jgi:hypothetical protein
MKPGGVASKAKWSYVVPGGDTIVNIDAVLYLHMFNVQRRASLRHTTTPTGEMKSIAPCRCYSGSDSDQMNGENPDYWPSFASSSSSNIPWTLCASAMLHPSGLGFGYCRLDTAKEDDGRAIGCNAMQWLYCCAVVERRSCLRALLRSNYADARS